MGNSGYNWDAERREDSEKIVRHLNTFGTITAREARDKYGIEDFRYYLKYLKKQGYKFDIEMASWKNLQGETVVGYVYRLIETPNA